MAAADRDRSAASRWTLHNLNNGVIFGWTCRGVRMLPPWASYGIGDASTWIAWHLLRSTRRALTHNLRAVFPADSDAALDRRALQTLRAYARDVIDFLRALQVSEDEARELFEFTPKDQRLFDELLAAKRGIILVTGHYGNWELGGVAMRRVFKLPLTVVTMPESSPEVERLRREIRDALEIDTLVAGQSLDTPLQIRKRLADNRIVALLMDRHIGRDRVRVQYLGRPAWFLRTPALMAFLTGAPLVPCFIERVGGARFSVAPGTPILVNTSIPRDEAIQQAAQSFADQLEARIRRNPQFWYHFYPYWDAQRDSSDPPA